MFMDKHVLFCEQVYTGSQIITQGLFEKGNSERRGRG